MFFINIQDISYIARILLCICTYIHTMLYILYKCIYLLLYFIISYAHFEHIEVTRNVGLQFWLTLGHNI